MFLNKIIFIDDHRCYQKGEEIKFDSNLTIITGDNGSGKSTLLSSIRSMYDIKWSFSHDLKSDSKIQVFGDFEDSKMGDVLYLDLSSDLYKNSSTLDYDNMGLYMQCLNSSSGEGVIYQLFDLISNNISTAKMIILDEPEKGLSLKNQILISRLINKFSTENPNVQFIVTTHSEKILLLKDKVWSATHKTYMPPDLFIELLCLI